ncbi:hypothetical protein EZV62_012967 [Acer yangbiense]|uniref:RING-type E3 ubiquitin transferase n=1 Tax=Acer yangbiense TaxID=1000413 RepID=A0A5C7HXQ5_9ROSI|nr:hypothetical protein EZV62_012967 [Acer yangbiense]
MTMDNNKEKLHVAIFPWLAYGHLMPFFQVAKFLAQKGHRISYISTPKNIRRLSQLPTDLSSNLFRFVQLALPHVDGLPLEAESTAELPIQKVPYLKKAYDLLQLPLTHFLQNSDVNWIILDFASYWLPSVASQLGLNSVYFSIVNATTCSFVGPPSELMGGRRQKPEDFTVVPDWIDYPNCRAFAVRSCPEFEPEAFSLLSRLLQKPVLPVGLLPPTLQDTASDDEKWQVFKDWLDSKSEKSVIYVALGTEVTLSQELMNELAFGLEKSGLTFIWVVRNRSLVEGEIGSHIIPNGFEDRVSGRGLVWRDWAPQLRILADPSVGGFLTHSGWSSVIEALGLGRVLILLSGASADTGLVARLMYSKRVGLEIERNEQDGSFTSESVAESIQRVMVSPEGEPFRANAWDMREIFGNLDLHNKYLNEFTNFIESMTYEEDCSLVVQTSSNMSACVSGGAPVMMTSVAIAVNGGTGSGSRRAVRWAAENLMPKADRFVLVHVIPSITSIPTPSGDCIPVTELDENVVKLYVQDVKLKTEEIFIPYKKLCMTRKVETLVLEGDNPATALLSYVSEAGINILVLGSCSMNCIMRKIKGPGVPTTVMRCMHSSCDVYIVSRQGIISKSANSASTSETRSGIRMLPQKGSGEGSSGINTQSAGICTYSVETRVRKTFWTSSISEISYPSSYASFAHIDSPKNASVDMESIQNLRENHETTTVEHVNSLASTKSEQSVVQSEVEQLRLELQATVSMYERACEELVHAQNKVQLLSNECHEEARRVNAALDRKETMSKIAAEEKAKHLQALKEVEDAKDLLVKETYGREVAELNALKESSEKQQIIDALLSSDRSNGEASKPIQIFEVEVLSQIRHPHMVLLLGACPENGCLVYEYLENGSLEDYIFHRNGKPSLPWFVRFRIVFEVACGLAFLHNSKPEPIVHRDLKPGNILLDRNYVSKIGDVGLAKLISDVVPDNITAYRDSILAGTLHYMDPEYQRTGTIRPKSDIYAFGVIILQLLTARHPNGLLLKVENALINGSFADILDNSVTDWPLAEVEELAQIAVKCSNLRCRDRPDLDNEVLPVLKRLKDVMEDPYIAADGFTYEHRAIKAWQEKHNVSPVTKLRFRHSMIIPNHTLRSAIQQWKSA